MYFTIIVNTLFYNESTPFFKTFFRKFSFLCYQGDFTQKQKVRKKTGTDVFGRVLHAFFYGFTL